MDLFTQTLFKVAVALYLLLAGVYVFFKERRNVGARRYVLLISTGALWVLIQALNTLLVYQGLSASLTSSIGGLFALGTSLQIYLFSLYYPTAHKSYKSLRIAGIAAALLLLPLVFHPRWIYNRVFVDGQVTASYGWAYAVYAAGAVALSAAGLVILGFKMRSIKEPSDAYQVKNIFWGLLITVATVSIFSGMLPVLGYPIFFSVGVMSVWFLGYYVFNSLLKYGVLDLKGELKLTLRFVFSILGIYLPTALVLWLVFKLADEPASPYVILYGLFVAVIVTRIKQYFLIPADMRMLFGPGRDSGFLKFKKDLLASDWSNHEFVRRLAAHFGLEPLAIATLDGTSSSVDVQTSRGPAAPDLHNGFAAGDVEGDDVEPVTAEEARKLGYEYVIKFEDPPGRGMLFVGSIGRLRPPTPLELSRVKHLLDVFIAQRKIKQLANRLEPAREAGEVESEQAEHGLHAESEITELVRGLSRSKAMGKAVSAAARYARLSESVLITGETGTGKEFVARYLHALSDKKEQELHVLDCASIPANLVESELFGHEKGSFTGADKRFRGIFERANGGNLFLDEIGELGLETQTRLLRVLNERTFQRVGGDEVLRTDARFFFATNRDFPDMIRKGTFRQDLYYRINVLHLHLPPMRNREEDIGPMAEYFLNSIVMRENLPARGFTRAAMDKILSHPWPGNARELKHVVHRAAVNASGSLIQPDVVEIGETETSHAVVEISDFLRGEKAGIVAGGYKEYVNRIEKEILMQMSDACGANQSLMARKLKLERNYLRRRLREFDLL